MELTVSGLCCRGQRSRDLVDKRSREAREQWPRVVLTNLGEGERELENKLRSLCSLVSCLASVK